MGLHAQLQWAKVKQEPKLGPVRPEVDTVERSAIRSERAMFGEPGSRRAVNMSSSRTASRRRLRVVSQPCPFSENAVCNRRS
jgi:hypothetical protein